MDLMLKLTLTIIRINVCLEFGDFVIMTSKDLLMAEFRLVNDKQCVILSSNPSYEDAGVYSCLQCSFSLILILSGEDDFHSVVFFPFWVFLCHQPHGGEFMFV